MTPVMTGPAEDRRPWFALAATGHPSVIPAGRWMTNPVAGRSLEVPGVARVWRALDAVLARRWAGCRIGVYCRAGWFGIDHAVRTYAEARKLPCLPVARSADAWGDSAGFRRDLELVGRCHAVLWFGPPESDGDPLALARLLGIPHQVVAELE